MSMDKLPPQIPNDTWLDHAAPVLGFFSAFSHWGVLPVLYLSGRRQFGSAAIRTSAMVSVVEFVADSEVCPLCSHLAHH